MGIQITDLASIRDPSPVINGSDIAVWFSRVTTEPYAPSRSSPRTALLHLLIIITFNYKLIRY